MMRRCTHTHAKTVLPGIERLNAHPSWHNLAKQGGESNDLEIWGAPFTIAPQKSSNKTILTESFLTRTRSGGSPLLLPDSRSSVMPPPLLDAATPPPPLCRDFSLLWPYSPLKKVPWLRDFSTLASQASKSLFRFCNVIDFNNLRLLNLGLPSFEAPLPVLQCNYVIIRSPGWCLTSPIYVSAM